MSDGVCLELPVTVRGCDPYVARCQGKTGSCTSRAEVAMQRAVARAINASGKVNREVSAEEAPVFDESITGAQLDAVRIGCMTACVLVDLDETIAPDRAAGIIQAIETARMFLDSARAAVGARRVSSVHVVGGQRESSLIVPG